MLSFTILAYAGSAALHGSGFAAVYVAALILGNAELPHRAATRSFSEGVAWLAQIGLFVMLGLLAAPSRIGLETVGIALVAGLALTLARPAALGGGRGAGPADAAGATCRSSPGRGSAARCRSCSRRSRWPRRSTGPTQLFDIVFVSSIIYTLLTGPTLPLVAKVLKVARAASPATWTSRPLPSSGSPPTCCR